VINITSRQEYDLDATYIIASCFHVDLICWKAFLVNADDKILVRLVVVESVQKASGRAEPTGLL
jgi:hypothetical protein